MYEITRYHTTDNTETLHFTTKNLKTARAELATVAKDMRADGLTVVLTRMNAVGRGRITSGGVYGIWYQITQHNQ